MRRLFNVDNPVLRAIGRVSDLCVLSVLWLATSLPIVTLGASTTALCATCVRIVRGNDRSLFRDYFSEFARGFRRATLPWLVLLVVGAVLSVDLYVWVNAAATLPGMLFAALSIGLALLYLLCLAYVFPLAAVYDGLSLRQTLLGALLIAGKRLLSSVGLLLALGGVVWLCVRLPAFLFVFLLLGPGVAAWVFSFQYIRAFERFGTLAAPDGQRRQMFDRPLIEDAEAAPEE